MPFPLSLSGAVLQDGLTVEGALRRLEDALGKADALGLSREGQCIKFRGGVFRWVSGWNVLVPISKGEVRVSAREHGVSVNYRISFGQMLVVVTVGTVCFFGPVVMRDSRFSGAGHVWLLLLMWSWLFGGNFAITLWKWPRFLLRSLSSPDMNPSRE